MIKLLFIPEMKLPYREHRALEKKIGIYLVAYGTYEIEDRELFTKFFSSLTEEHKLKILLDTVESCAEVIHDLKHTVNTTKDKLNSIRALTNNETFLE